MEMQRDTYRSWDRRMYKITGHLNVARNDAEGGQKEFVTIKYARFLWIARKKALAMQMFYDWVGVERI